MLKYHYYHLKKTPNFHVKFRRNGNFRRKLKRKEKKLDISVAVSIFLFIFTDLVSNSKILTQSIAFAQHVNQSRKSCPPKISRIPILDLWIRSWYDIVICFVSRRKRSGSAFDLFFFHRVCLHFSHSHGGRSLGGSGSRAPQPRRQALREAQECCSRGFSIFVFVFVFVC